MMRTLLWPFGRRRPEDEAARPLLGGSEAAASSAASSPPGTPPRAWAWPGSAPASPMGRAAASPRAVPWGLPPLRLPAARGWPWAGAAAAAAADHDLEQGPPGSPTASLLSDTLSRAGLLSPRFGRLLGRGPAPRRAVTSPPATVPRAASVPSVAAAARADPHWPPESDAGASLPSSLATLRAQRHTCPRELLGIALGGAMGLAFGFKDAGLAQPVPTADGGPVAGSEWSYWVYPPLFGLPAAITGLAVSRYLMAAEQEHSALLLPDSLADLDVSPTVARQLRLRDVVAAAAGGLTGLVCGLQYAAECGGGWRNWFFPPMVALVAICPALGLARWYTLPLVRAMRVPLAPPRLALP